MDLQRSSGLQKQTRSIRRLRSFLESHVGPRILGSLSLSLHATWYGPGPPKTGVRAATAPSGRPRPNRAGPPKTGNPCCFGGQPAQLASGTVHCAPPTTLTFSTTPDRIAAPIRLHRATNAVQMAPGQYQSAVRNPDTSGRQTGGTAAYSPRLCEGSCPNRKYFDAKCFKHIPQTR